MLLGEEQCLDGGRMLTMIVRIELAPRRGCVSAIPALSDP